MFARLGRLAATHPWRVIAVWVLAFAAIVPFSPSLDDVTNEDQTSFLPARYESVRAQRLAERHFPSASGATARFVVMREDGRRLSALDRRRVGTLAERLDAAGVGAVNSVSTSPELLAPSGTAQLIEVAFAGESTDEPVKEAVRELRRLAGTALAGGDLSARLTGDAAIALDADEAFGTAESVTFVVTIALIVVLVGLIFRSPVAAFLPILTIGLVFTLASALIALLADTFGFEVDSSLTSLLIVVLFGIGTDYILFLLFRYRERLRAGDESRAAVGFAVRRVGKAVASSALVVIIAFLALLLAELGFFQTLAPGLVIAVAVALLASLTLIPATMALIGPRLFWPSQRWRVTPEGAHFKRLGRLIARRPGTTALVSGGLMAVLASCAAFYTPNYDTYGALPADAESTTALEDVTEAFSAGAVNPTMVYVSASEPLRPGDLALLASRLGSVKGVESVAKPVLSTDGRGAVLTVSLDAGPTSNEALDIAGSGLRAAARGAVQGAEVRVGGTSSAFADIRTALDRDMALVFPVAALLIALVLGVLLRSLIAPLYLLAAVSLGFAATLGAGVVIFQGVGGEPGLLFSLPIMLYLFVVAIGTDYNILMTTRLREEVREGNDPRLSADLSVEHAGPTVVSAGVILAGTFASLGLTRISLLVQMGSIIAIGVLIVSFVMAAVFVPSLSALIGRKVWWPGHQDRPGAEEGDVAPVRATPAGELASGGGE